jgi:hypothetical protein
LRLKDANAQEKAALLSSHSLSATERIPAEAEAAMGFIQAPTKLSPLDTQMRLIDQCEALRDELRQREQNWNRERVALQKDNTQRILSIEQTAKSDLLAARHALSQLEDALTATRESLMQSERDRESLRAQQRIFEERTSLANKESDQLRAELQTMQQGVAASYRLDVSHSQFSTGSGPATTGNATNNSVLSTLLASHRLPADIESALRIREAQFEAKLKQLLNKLDFLKNQIDNEKKVSDELRLALSERERQRDKDREELHRRQRQQEQDVDKLLQEREQEICKLYESRMVELTTLQRDMLTIKHEQEGSLREKEQFRQREETMLLQTQRLNVQLQSNRTEIESLKAELLQKTLEKEEHDRKETNKLSQEVVVRRLDSERQYLKSQLTAEMALKSELQVSSQYSMDLCLFYVLLFFRWL